MKCLAKCVTVFSQHRQLVPCSSSTILLPRIVQCKSHYAGKIGVMETRKVVKQYNCFTFQYPFDTRIRKLVFSLQKRMLLLL